MSGVWRQPSFYEAVQRFPPLEHHFVNLDDSSSSSRVDETSSREYFHHDLMLVKEIYQRSVRELITH